MNALSNSTPDVRPVPDKIPVLTQPMQDVPTALVCALDARAAEKQAFMALSAELLQQLRPEFDRLAAGLVHRTLETAWHHKVNTPPGP
ncbi:hypothetical protein [Limnohabitans sp.]|uniref:hypothetical protein n=1 Tax=Limnohabitans sp. TaxID=1907725 RepID=UPI0039BD075D|nr:hypothetical protein [Comamonadaceae bacterium]